MAKTLERQVKDAVIAKLRTISGIGPEEAGGLTLNGVAVDHRQKALLQDNHTSAIPWLTVEFPYVPREGGCGYLIKNIQCEIGVFLLYDTDADDIASDTVGTAIDLVEQRIEAAMLDDTTWSSLAHYTSPAESKETTGESLRSDAYAILSFEIEIHYKGDDPHSAF